MCLLPTVSSFLTLSIGSEIRSLTFGTSPPHWAVQVVAAALAVSTAGGISAALPTVEPIDLALLSALPRAVLNNLGALEVSFLFCSSTNPLILCGGERSTHGITKMYPRRLPSLFSLPPLAN